MSDATNKALAPEVEAVLNQDHLDYRKPLLKAWEWNRGGVKQQLEWAAQLLDALAETDPGKLPVWYEKAFNLVKRGRPEEALKLLADTVEGRFRRTLDVDTLALWGRLLKDRGDRHLSPERPPEEPDNSSHPPPRPAEAEAEYALAEEKYERAYQIDRDRFPGINVATLRLLRAAALKRIALTELTPGGGRDESRADNPRVAVLLDGSRARAAEVLATRGNWVKRLPDDAIWMDATEAEARVLAGDWAAAEARYRTALRSENGPRPHHKQSMAAQLKRLVPALSLVGVNVPPPLHDPDAFFAGLAPAAA